MTKSNRFLRNFANPAAIAASLLCTAPASLHAQAPTSAPAVPTWAQPASATHTQVSPPSDFHRPTTTFNLPIGAFDGQSDVGSAVVPGSATYDAASGKYTVNSAGYNIWYNRDEFRFLWKKLSGDASLAAEVSFPNPKGFGDRKAVIIIRQSLDDDSTEVLAGLHGTGMLQFAQRAQKGARITDSEFRFDGRGRPEGATPDSLVTLYPKRIGIEKHGDAVFLYVSVDGEPMHLLGPPIPMKLDGPFYIGIGFCSHLPDHVDTAIISDVVIENTAGKVR